MLFSMIHFKRKL